MEKKTTIGKGMKLAHNAPNPGGIKRALLKKYPSLKGGKKKS